MEPVYVPPTREMWVFSIFPYVDNNWRAFVQDVPPDPARRDTYELRPPIMDWLAKHEHTLAVDTGDMGEGTEYFYIRVYTLNDATDLTALLRRLRDEYVAVNQ